MTLVATMLWERLDVPGHDACRLERRNGSWEIRGHAIFEHESKPCSLSYSTTCGVDWRTDRATVTGWLGSELLDLDIRRTGADWSLNDLPQPQVSGCIDLDLGFSPATNLIAIRRLELDIGEQSPAPAAYLSFPELRLDLLEQHYRRTGDRAYAYSAPAFSYSEVLEVSEVGFVVNYPGLWEGRILQLG
jgi:uncharacterized protein